MNRRALQRLIDNDFVTNAHVAYVDGHYELWVTTEDGVQRVATEDNGAPIQWPVRHGPAYLLHDMNYRRPITLDLLPAEAYQ